MQRYVRTTYGAILPLLDIKTVMNWSAGHNQMRWYLGEGEDARYLTADKVVRVSADLRKLVDTLVIRYMDEKGNFLPPEFNEVQNHDICTFKVFNGRTYYPSVFGAIWSNGPKGEPILTSVIQIDLKTGKAELL